MSIDHQPPKWNILSQDLVADCNIFQVYKRHCQHPSDPRSGDFFSIKSRDFVIILALTDDNHLITVEQYRFGSDEVHLEVPGGVVDKDEDHKAAAARELLEETGYSGSSPQIIGSCRPNPAIFDNTAYFVFIKNCKKTHDTNWDEHEEIRVSTRPLKQAYEDIKSQHITHGITILGLSYLKLFLD